MNPEQTPTQKDAPSGAATLDPETASSGELTSQPRLRLLGKRAAMVVFSQYPADPRPRRAAEALVQEGMAVDYLCEGESGGKRRESLDKLDITRIPIEHHRGGLLSYAYQYSAFILFSMFILAWRSLRKRYDLIYVHNMPDVLVACALFPKLLGAKVILDQHDPMPELMMTIFGKDANNRRVKLLCALERWSLRRADRVITVNEACVRLFSARGCPEEKIRVVMNSPDEKLFSYRAARSYPQPATDAPFVIMYHGSLVERNGLDLAVAALARLLEDIPLAELRVYGRQTPYLDQVLAKAEKLGVQNNVHYLGARKLERLAAEIQKCDVGIIPNQRNAFTDINTPTRILEYLALGKPVVAPNTRGILDYFGNDELFYFTSGDAEGMADAIRRVAANREEAVANAERGQRVYLHHTWQREREALVQSVCELACGNAARTTASIEDMEGL